MTASFQHAKERAMASPKLVFCTVAAASLIALPVTSHARVNIEVEIAPPVAVYEAAPPRDGFIWVPGYWNWDARRHEHVWRKGYYTREHRGDHWVAHEWVEREGRYRLNEGHWEHDADRRHDHR
jgi:hypothetical protein